MTLEDWLARKEVAVAARVCELHALPISSSRAVSMVAVSVSGPEFNGLVFQGWTPN